MNYKQIDVSDITQINGIRTCPYYKHINSENHIEIFYGNLTESEIVVECGKFKAHYLLSHYGPIDSYRQGWKRVVDCETTISFYDSNTNELLFEKNTRGTPCLIIYSTDPTNQTSLNTFFCVRSNVERVKSINGSVYNDKYWLVQFDIFNMNNELIKQVNFGEDCFTDFKQVSNKYAIYGTEEACTGEQTTQLVDLDIFFSSPSDEKCRSSFICIDTESQLYENVRFLPLICHQDGFIVKDVTTSEIVNMLIPYEDIYYDKFSFYTYSDDE